MYKVFIDQKPVVFIHLDELSTVNNTVTAEEILTTLKWKTHLKHVTLEDPLFVGCVDPKAVFKQVFKQYKKIKAAGGIVQRENTYLVITRKGLWDIPKGRMNKGESSEDACIREIMEECGIDGHRITAPLTETYHTMKWNGRRAIKRTFWYKLEYDGPEETYPETSEGITHAEWKTRDELLGIRENTFGSIHDVVNAFELQYPDTDALISSGAEQNSSDSEQNSSPSV